jgi:hypothetical protein
LVCFVQLLFRVYRETTRFVRRFSNNSLKGSRYQQRQGGYVLAVLWNNSHSHLLIHVTKASHPDRHLALCRAAHAAQ